MGEPTTIELKDNECAIVVNQETFEVEFFLPKYEDEEDVPYPVILMAVVAGLINKQEPEFMGYLEKMVDEVMYKMDKGEGSDDTSDRS